MQKLIVIPARGGSKGIPGKNIFPVNGKPLIEYTLEVALGANLDKTDIAVSTNSKAIMDVAEKYKGVHLIQRPDNISGDKTKTEDALIHAIKYMEEKTNKKYDAVITLQVTSPLRKNQTLIDFVHTYEQNFPKYDAQLSLNENRADFWVEETDKQFVRLFPDAPRRRQERKPLYVENSAYYITDVKALRMSGSVLGTKVNGYIIAETEAVDINEPIDIVIAESLLKDNGKEKDHGRNYN